MKEAMPSCADFNELLLDYAYGELDAAETRRVETHLGACAKCQAELAQVGGIRRTMGELSFEPAPQTGLESLLAYAEQQAARTAAAPPRAKGGRWRWLVPAMSAGGLAAVLMVVVSQHQRLELRLPSPGLSAAGSARARSAEGADDPGAPAPAVAAGKSAVLAPSVAAAAVEPAAAAEPAQAAEAAPIVRGATDSAGTAPAAPKGGGAGLPSRAVAGFSSGGGNASQWVPGTPAAGALAAPPRSLAKGAPAAPAASAADTVASAEPSNEVDDRFAAPPPPRRGGADLDEEVPAPAQPAREPVAYREEEKGGLRAAPAPSKEEARRLALSAKAAAPPPVAERALQAPAAKKEAAAWREDSPVENAAAPKSGTGLGPAGRVASGAPAAPRQMAPAMAPSEAPAASVEYAEPPPAIAQGPARSRAPAAALSTPKMPFGDREFRSAAPSPAPRPVVAPQAAVPVAGAGAGKASSDPAGLLLEQAAAQARSGDRSGAVESYARFLAAYPVDPRAPRAMLERARLLEQTGQARIAEQTYRELAVRYASTPEADSARRWLESRATGAAPAVRSAPAAPAAQPAEGR